METSAFWAEVEECIREAIGSAFAGRVAGSVGGGCISRSDRLTGNDGRSFFVKQNGAGFADVFAAEALGLRALASTQTIRVPEPICHGIAAGRAFLVLEWLDLGGAGSERVLGERLAALHACSLETRYGWERDNHIGATEQRNRYHDDWATFFLEERLDFQVALARRRGGKLPRYDQLRPRVAALLAGHDLRPSLLHGDLWSGNAAYTHSGEPVIYDPAVYFGDREADLAMSELFGGFGAGFYRAYDAVWPREAGYPVRRTLYNLYHILNHYNLFGGFYLSRANAMISDLLTQS